MCIVRDILRLDLAVILVSKHLNRVEKISNCVAVIFSAIFVLLSDSK